MSDSKNLRDDLFAKLAPFGQEQLLTHWSNLDDEARARLASQIAAIDLAAINRFVEGADGAPDWEQLARRAHPPRAIRLAGHNEFSREAAARKGEETLRAGKVAMLLVAGGQGTRLGFPHPKGMLPLGPVSHRTLFQIIIDRLRAMERRYRVRIPLYLMTSPATHAETVAHFEMNTYLGLRPAEVRFFTQGMLPAVDRQTGRILLEEPGSIALSPDGHGGMLDALARSGSLAELCGRGIETVFYGQVDNPLLQVCDPMLLGFHLLAGSEMTTQVVEKRHALERVGNVVEVDGQTRIIEYSDLPEQAALRRTPEGTLYLWAGNLAVHLFDVAFLTREVAQADALPIHRAFKKVSYFDPERGAVEPTSPNAIKFERFIFDLMPQARNAFVVEADPADAFAPVKNAPGEATDTPVTAQAAMMHRDRRLLREAGVCCDENVDVEVNPLWALDADEARGKLPPDYHLSTPVYFDA